MLKKLASQIALALLDVALISLAFYLSYAMRFDFSIPEARIVQIRELIAIVILAYLGALLYFGLYRGMWRYAGIADMLSILKAVSLGTALLIVVDFSQNYTAGLSFAALFFIIAVVGQTGGRRIWLFVKRQDPPVLLVLLPLFILLLYPVFKAILSSFIPVSVGIGEWFNSHFIAARAGVSAKIPRSVVALNWVLSLLFIGGSRMGFRLWKERRAAGPSQERRVLIVGAGDAGEQVMREMKRNLRLGYHPVGFIDDDPRKKGMRIHGVQVVGTRQQIKRIVDEYNVVEIVIAIPSVRGERLKQIVECCQISKIQLRILPSMGDLIDGKVRVSYLRQVSPEDLLERDEVQVDIEQISGYLTGKTVLVTGAGGSIGSELCRQIARYEPEKLLLLGAGENSIYEIQMELNTRFPRLNKISLIGNIRDERRIGQVFKQYHPQIVFHGAAHKHVPLMELNPDEAIKNNILGTRNVAQAALRCGVEKFVFISTDKAVNPTSVMGASKRVAELLIHKLAQENQTQFIIVRFGNVLDSRGSVIPLFKKQISLGGPVTVTHPEATRYFMTIPEAAQLVIQSGAMGKGGEVFVLDMGEQVKIVDLARNLIRLSGLEPDKDIRIEYTGLRPGEKLYEELLTAAEGTIATRHEKIFISKPENVDHEKLIEAIKKLERYSRNGSRTEIIQTLKDIVPTYTPGERQVKR